ncbi:DUF1318 domain-containing protein [Propionivibrio dicarboxylicus]|uniref:DUF1318 domain-containing protein n=1 Tax=Propionivibrio dicarboxylicus TaxID=83767 RepID=A0A1G7XQ95_9RHOO|nr:DUF1318 domain-containing protein [Propionivibrio dicarboxylicus]SDG85810.1 Protein of unknown function [Propionivibrio dicarboxylicus]
MRTLIRVAGIVAVLSLAACESTPNRLLTYAAAGTEIQAERLVGQMFGEDVWPLPYQGRQGAINIAEPLARMQARFPQLQQHLERGEIGLTDDGKLAVREVERVSPELFQLVRDENDDRDVFYYGMCIAVGHGDDSLSSWLSFVRTTFGKAWQAKSPAGWWRIGSKGEWVRK